jgi:hypothetical protein
MIGIETVKLPLASAMTLELAIFTLASPLLSPLKLKDKSLSPLAVHVSVASELEKPSSERLAYRRELRSKSR